MTDMEIFCSNFYRCLMLTTINSMLSFSSNAVDIVVDDNFGFIWTQGSDVSNQHSVICSSCTTVSDKSLENATNKGRPYPGGRAETAFWCDALGNLWMFGGIGFDDLPSEEPRLLNDLWLFNYTTQTWKIVKRETQDANKLPLPTKDQKLPKKRRQSAACGVTGLIFVVYGGIDDEGTALSDTWLFDSAISKWLPLSANHNLQNVTLSVHPPARYDMASWCLDDRLVIFGGHGQDAKLDDMWTFSLQSLTWSRMEQFSLTKDIPNQQETLFPPSVVGPVTWTGVNHTLLLVSHDCHGNSSEFPNIWEFSLETGSWKMMNIEFRPSCLSNTTDIGGYLNVHQHSAAWLLPSDNVLIFGGKNIQNCDLEVAVLELTYDLLVLNSESKCWSKITLPLKVGSEELSTPQHFFMKSVPSARTKMTFWQHQQTLYLFGGVGYDGRGTLGFLNDLWIRNQKNASFIAMTTKAVMSPPKLFMIVLSAVGGTALLFGSSFCLRRITCHRRKRSRKAYNVHYSPLSNETEFE